MSDTDTTLAEVRRLLMSEVSGCQERIRELEELVETAYREGFGAGYALAAHHIPLTACKTWLGA